MPSFCIITQYYIKCWISKDLKKLHIQYSRIFPKKSKQSGSLIAALSKNWFSHAPTPDPSFQQQHNKLPAFILFKKVRLKQFPEVLLH